MCKNGKLVDPATWDLGTSLDITSPKQINMKLEDIKNAGIKYIEFSWLNGFLICLTLTIKIFARH